MYRHKGQGGVGFEVLLFSRFIQLKGMDGIEEFLLNLIWILFFFKFLFSIKWLYAKKSGPTQFGLIWTLYGNMY